MCIPRYYIFEDRSRTKKHQIFKSNYPPKITRNSSKIKSGLSKVVPRKKLLPKPILDVKISTYQNFRIFCFFCSSPKIRKFWYVDILTSNIGFGSNFLRGTTFARPLLILELI